MSFQTANINWLTPAGSTGVLVEYRKQVNSTWIRPTSPANPTMTGTYPLSLEVGVKYWVRLSSSSFRCASGYIIKEVVIAPASCCPVGYTLSPDGSHCYKEETVAATPPAGGGQNAMSVTNMAYSTCGSYIYAPGYSLDGTGTSVQINPSNAFWVNGAGACFDATLTNGPMNRTAIWATTIQSNQDIGFGVCLNIPTTTTYYVGVGCDNYAIIKLDGVTILQQDPTNLGTQYGVGVAAAFKVWHIYPVQISAGPHILEIIGHNDTGAAGLGCEIYNATSTELQAATSYASLGSKLIFSSKDYVGQPIQIGTGNAGYTCPSGYALQTCAGRTPSCKRILTSPLTSC